MADTEDLIQLHLTEPDTPDVTHGRIAGVAAEAANGAPTREPEVWDERIVNFNPIFGHTPEPAPLAVSPQMAEAAVAGTFDVGEYLAEERTKDLLRFSTAGSVDDGKSTLIGRLLYDTQSVYDDQVRSIEGKGTTAPGVLDLALLTDGLRAEREQGITIDVAYRYFSTERRKFIIADTPGHEQYTRNMATGASTASLAIVLVDARKGVLIQSRRHACITVLLGVRHLVVAVNKMDLVSYDQTAFRAVEVEFTRFFEAVQAELNHVAPIQISFVPVSALSGENVVHCSTRMPWYEGPSLLTLLESSSAADAETESPFRLAVQRVIRPHLDFRGFAGQIAAGTIRPGDAVVVLPSRRTTHVRRIVTFSGDLAEARAPQSITLTLDDEVDISRGDLLVSPNEPATVATVLTASLVWMDELPMDLTRRYLLKHTSRTVQVQVTVLHYRLDVAMLEHQPASTLTLNAIGLVELQAMQPLAVDRYARNRKTGSFVLIDPVSNATVAAGMIRDVGQSPAVTEAGAVSTTERAEMWGHSGAHIYLSGSAAFADSVERALLKRRAVVVRPVNPTAALVKELILAGVLVLTHAPDAGQTVTLGEQEFGVSNVEELLQTLERNHVLQGGMAR